MEFRTGRWANLVFVSTLGSPRSTAEIADCWDVPREEIERDEILREAERLEQVKFFERTGDRFLAKTDSQAFRTEVENYFRHESDRDLTRAEKELFTGIVADLEIRKKAFDIDSVTCFYLRDAEEAKKQPLAIFEGVLYAVDKVMGNEREPSLPYNVEVLEDNLREIESERPQMLEKI